MTTFTEDDFEQAMKEAGEELEDKTPEGTAADEDKAPDPKPVEKPAPARLADDDSIPAELRGKSVEEALGIYQQLKQTSQGLAQQFQKLQEKPAPKAPDPISADDLVEADGANFNKKLNEFFDAKITPLQQTLLQTAAQNNRQAMVARSEILKKYEPTLDAVIQQYQLGPEQLARQDVWAQLEMVVAQQHFNEIVAEKAQALQKPRPEMSAGARATPEGGDNEIQLTAQEKAVADGMGVSHKAYAQMKRFVSPG